MCGHGKQVAFKDKPGLMAMVAPYADAKLCNQHHPNDTLTDRDCTDLARLPLGGYVQGIVFFFSFFASA